MKLILEEHFDNLNNWNFEYGFVRNHEDQYYVDRNIKLENGITIYGKKEKIENSNYDRNSQDWRKNRRFGYYTSTSINTKGHFDFKYGMMEVKARIPISIGAWPAIWLMGSEEEYPYCDEVDIMEMYLWQNQPTILGNFMYYGNQQCNWNTKMIAANYFKEKDNNWENQFHIWKLDWNNQYMRIYLDDELINQIEIAKFKNGNFHKNYYILLNLAIGGHGALPEEGELPLKYEIEYVKVYQKEEDYNG